MAKNEKTSKRIAKIASFALKHPRSLTTKQIKSLAGSVLTQRPDRKRR